MQSRFKLRWLSSVILTAVLVLLSYSFSVDGLEWAQDGLSFGSVRRVVSREHEFSRVDLDVEREEMFSSNGLTDQVEWDQYSLIVKGQRIFLHSGEFHTFRLPVPSLWLDILQKVKAAGLNAISVYTHWGLINPSPGVIDFDGFRALQPLFDVAKATGIWIVLRPGPYINAETTAGGIAHWVTSQVAGTLRTNATDYRDAWQDYISGIINVTKPNQITEGGPVIDNEYFQSGFGNAEYFQELEDAYRAGGIVVPLTYNDPGEGKNFVNGTGAVDIYGLDSYPQGFDCSNPETWSPVVQNYHDYHEGTNPSQPFYIPEFQGGSFDAWGPNAPGYPACQELTGADFEDVFYKTLWAANARLINYYMIYGGTSWGAIPFAGVYTSYDYGSSISENRLLTSKYAELKRQALFLRSSPEFYKTNWVGNSSSSAVNVSNPNAFVVFLENPDTGAGFYIARQTSSTSTDTTEFNIQVSTSNGTLSIPQTVPSITLSGRQSKVIVTDYAFGASSRVLYSTASVLFAGQIGGRDVLFLFGDADQQHEFALDVNGGSIQMANSSSNVKIVSSSSGASIISIVGNVTGLVTIFDSDSQLVLYSDTDTAGTFFAPVIPSSSATGDTATFSDYWQIGSNTTILVGGPYLVRNASISGTELNLRGDLNESVMLTVFSPPEIRTVTWNGQEVEPFGHASASSASRGEFVGQLQTKVSSSAITVPELKNWKFADSLPEIQANFSDADWTIANHTTTNIPFKPYYGDGRVLYGCDYEFCENIVLWRGHFNATGSEKSVNLSINGGEAFAASVWLNDIFLGTSFGNSSNNENILEETDEVFDFPDGSVVLGQSNVVTIVQDNMGLNETGDTTDTSKSPRGIRGFQLNKGNFSDWKVQGKLGGYTNFPDKVRGVFNEGGLFGEREGWHLPGFDTSSWVERDLSEGLPGDNAGVGFFVTTFSLDIPEETDVPISFLFDGGSSLTVQPYRAILFVNGWMMGKRVANLGPQTKFPVQQGILDFKGENTVAIALWSMLPNGSVSPTLNLEVDGVLEGGVGGIVTNNPGFSSRTQVLS
ncbi:glycoside hydrolase family 35 protein [Phellopilus nigrolimitatus]|nr:glycoside hydrolase family 35 protein [Phellopilus nigrolimitatus]